MAVNPNALDIAADPVDAFDCTACGTSISVGGQVAFSPFRCPHCSAMQSVPLRLGPFLLLHLLGKGGMGAVYRALDTTLHRYVAIKVMQQSLGRDPKFVQDFLREARAAAQFNHPHVAQIYSFGEEKGQACLVMELLEGGSLDAMISTGEPLDEVRVLTIAVQVADALKAANKIGLRHGDIKPANILFSKSGQPKVVDFGLAWYAESHQKPGEIWGTPYYIAPEKVEAKPADQRADMYSFGGTFFHALTGRAPFEGETARDLVIKRLREPAPDVRSLRPDLSPRTADVIARTLQRDPARRHPTYKSLLADLELARDEAAARQAAAAAAQAAPARRVPAWGLAVVAVLAAAAVAGGVWWKRSAAPDDGPRPLRHVLVDGRLVPIYTEEEEAARRERVAAERATPPAASTDRALSQREQQALREAIALAAGGEAIGASISLQRLLRDGPPDGSGAALVRLTLALSVLLEGEAEIARSHLQAIVDEYPAAIPAGALARLLLGQTDLAALGDAMQDWSESERLYARFVDGVASLWRGHREKGIETLRAFESAAAGNAAWVAAWTPAVETWASSLENWRSMEAKVPGWSRAYARRQLRTFRREAPWFLRDDVQTALQQLDEVRIEEATPTPPPAVPSAEEARKEDEARLESLRSERSTALAALHEFLADRLTQNPPPRPVAELRGTIVGADLEGVNVSPREGVTLRRRWDEVDPRLYVRLADYYARREPGTPAERAERFLALAAYSDDLGATDRVAAYVQLAIAADVAVEPRAREWFPALENGAAEPVRNGASR